MTGWDADRLAARIAADAPEACGFLIIREAISRAFSCPGSSFSEKPHRVMAHASFCSEKINAHEH
jgi:hypothetical protein